MMSIIKTTSFKAPRKTFVVAARAARKSAPQEKILKNLTDSNQELLPLEKLESTKNLPIFLFENYLFNDLYERLQQHLNLNYAFNLLQF